MNILETNRRDRNPEIPPSRFHIMHGLGLLLLLMLFVEPHEAQPVFSSIEILAAGTTGEEIIELEIDGQFVAQYALVDGDANSGQFISYFYTDENGTPINKIKVKFINDLNNGTIDRNVRVDAIIVDGIRFESEDETVFSVGTWRAEDGCAPGFKQSEFLHCNGYLEYQIGSTDQPVVGAFGSDRFTHNFVRARFGKFLESPIVITGPPTFNGGQGGVVGINGINNYGFNVRFREWSYLDHTHAEESVDWLALDRGTYLTADGSIWEVGTFSLSGNNQFKTIEFASSFTSAPYVLTTLQTTASTPVAVRIRNVSQWRFDAALFEEEAQLGTPHPLENVGYLAILPSANSGIVTIDGQVLPYQFQSLSVGSGPVAVNNRNSIFAQEEQSRDAEIIHGRETVAVLTLGDRLFAQDQTFLGHDTIALRAIRRSSPITVPSGFEFIEVLDAAQLNNAIAVEVAPDGRIFVAEEGGVIWVVENGVKLATPYLDLSDQVANEFLDEGAFSGFVLDPNFGINGLIYVMFTTEQRGEGFGVVQRYAQSTSNPNLVDQSSQFVLLGGTPQNRLIKDTFHNVGDLEFGSDGSLLVSWGDTASNEADDPRMLRSQDLNAAAGKVFRINPGNGLGYASNPFFTGNADDMASRVWVLGVRNGFRIEVQPETGSSNPADGNPGTLVIADVGRHEFEELNIVTGGENLGWPYFEGTEPFREGGEGLSVTDPAIVYSHPGARSIIGGAFYSGTGWPAEYTGRYFAADFVEGWVRSYHVHFDESVTGFDFGTQIKGITDMVFDPLTGQLYLVGRGKNLIFSEGEGLDGLYTIKFGG